MKEQEYEQLAYEVDEIKSQYNKLLQEQNLMYEHYFREKERFFKEKQLMEKEVLQVKDQLREEEAKQKVYKEFHVANEKKELREQMFHEQTKRIAILDVNLIKLSRKYDSLNDEYLKIKELYESQQLN